jgi:hypothetical protein
LKLHALKLIDRLAKLLPLAGVSKRALERARAMPIICAPIPMRPSFSVSIEIL